MFTRTRNKIGSLTNSRRKASAKRSSKRATDAARTRTRLLIEELETRTVPSTIYGTLPITASAPGAIFEIDTATGATTTLLETPSGSPYSPPPAFRGTLRPEVLAVAPNGKILFIGTGSQFIGPDGSGTGNSGQLFVLDPATDVPELLDSNPSIYSVTTGSDGSIYAEAIGQNHSSGLFQIDPVFGQETLLWGHPINVQHPGGIAVEPNGDILTLGYSDGISGVYRVDHTSHSVSLLDANSGIQDIAVVPLT